MGSVFTSLLAITCVILIWQLFRLRTILNDFADAVSQKSIYLQHTPSRTIRMFKIDHLIRVYTELLIHERKMHEMENQMQNQIEAVLGKIQEAVFSIDQNNTIVHSNTSACETFNRGKPIRGKRIEEMIRNPEFLDYAHLAKIGRPQVNREVSVSIEGKTRWFEVSGTPIPKSSFNPYGSVMFVFHDITRLKHLEVVKNNFVANVSHELKTPITVIKGFTETLIDDNEALSPEMRIKFLSKIQSNSERLNLIVQDLLTLSRIESEPEFIQRSRDELTPILEAIVENFRNLKKPGQTILLTDRIPGLILNMDGFKIGQVLQNLTENAIRYSGDDSTIEIITGFDETKRSLTCTVRDNGKGIPEEDLPNIFRRFYRVDKARSRVHGGTGLGLSIARGIIELHGGRIYAENRPEGGLAITFTLPVDPPATLTKTSTSG